MTGSNTNSNGLAGQEVQVLRRTIIYGVIITAIIDAITWLAIR